MSVINMNVENVLTTIADTFRPQFKHIKCKSSIIIEEGIAIKFQMRLDSYNCPCSESKDFVAIFSSNTSVFVAEIENSYGWEETPELFVNTSNHESCWKTDGLHFLTEAYFEMAKLINKVRVDKGFCELAPVYMIQANRFSFSNSVQRVRIHKELTDDSYHYNLKKIETLPLFEEI